MIVLFIDSDIILDLLLQRVPHLISAAEMMKLADDAENYRCCTSVHSLLNIHYLAKKAHGEQATRSAIKSLTQKLTIVTEDTAMIQQAISSAFSDFEDAVHYIAAQRVNSDFIITRNTKDYQHSAIPVLTAEQFLRKIS